MKEEVFKEKKKAAEIMFIHERERKWYWGGYSRGLKVNFNGVEADNKDHIADMWLQNIDAEDYKKNQYHTGYRDAFFFGNSKIGIPLCHNCNKPMFYDGYILSHKFAIFACHCGHVTEYEIVTGKWSSPL